MKKLSVLLLAFLAILTIATAQNNIGIEENDPKAKAILDQVKAKYEAYKSLEASFTLVIEFPEEEAEEQSGQIAQSGEKYKLDLGGQSIICNGQTIWYYLKNRNEVQINSVEEGMEDDEMLSPQNLLRIYEKEDFLYALVGEEVEAGVRMQKIEFKPLDQDTEYFKMRLTINKKTKEIVRIKTFSKDGSRYTLRIDQLKANKDFSAEYFAFDEKQYPGVYVEDLRMD